MGYRYLLAAALFVTPGFVQADPASSLREALLAMPAEVTGAEYGPGFGDFAAATAIMTARQQSAGDGGEVSLAGITALAAPPNDTDPWSINPQIWAETLDVDITEIVTAISAGDHHRHLRRFVMSDAALKRATAALLANENDSYYFVDSLAGPLILTEDEDYAVDLGMRWQDPFRGSTGLASRILFEGPVLYQSAGLAELDATLAESTWGDLPLMQGLLDALDRLPGDWAILNALVLPDQAVLAPADSVENLPQGIPEWQLGIFAHAATVQESFSLIALVYDDAAAAEEARSRVDRDWEQSFLHGETTWLDAAGPITLKLRSEGEGPHVLLGINTQDWDDLEFPGSNIYQRIFLNALVRGDLGILGPAR